MNLTNGYVFDGAAAVKHSALSFVLPGEIRAETVILHGCVPVSSFLEITRIDGAEVFELDGQPALEVLERMLAIPIGTSVSDTLSLTVTLGEKHGDRFGPYDENAYVNRLILRTDPERKSFTLFEPDFRTGSLVQVISRDNGLMIESVRCGASDMSERCRDRDSLLTLYVDCAGGASAPSAAAPEEAAVLPG